MTAPDRTLNELFSTAAERRAFRGFLAVTFILLGAFFIAPEGIEDGLYFVLALWVLTSGGRRVRSLPHPVRLPTLLVVLAGTSQLLSGVVRNVDGVMREADYPFPSPADVFVVLAYGLFIAAILVIVRRRVGRIGIDPLLDSVVGGLAAGIANWTLIIHITSTRTVSVGQQLTMVGFSMITMVAFMAAILALVSGSQPTPSNRYLAAALIVTFSMDGVANLVTVDVLSVRVLNVLGVVALVLGGTGLLHPSMKHLLDRPTGSSLRRRLSNRRIAVLAFALVAPPLLLLMQVLSGGKGFALVLPAAGSIVLTPMVLVRLGRLVRQNELLATQERTLRTVGERLVEAEMDGEVAMILESGAQHLIGSELIDAGLVEAPFTTGSQGWTSELAPALRAMQAELAEISRPSTGDLVALHSVGVDGNWYGGLLAFQGEVRGVFLIGVDKPLGTDQSNAVTALCRQGAIAIRAARRTEEQVRERAEQRFGTLIENSSDIVTILGEDHELVYTSPVCKRLLGFDPEPGFAFELSQLVHRDDLERAEALLSDVVRTGHGSEELRLRHLNGTYLWFEVQATDLTDDPDVAGVLLNARAVDDRKAAEHLLLLSEARFKSLVQNNSDLVMVIDDHDRVNYASPSAIEMVGQTPDALFGLSMSGVFMAADIDWPSKLRETARSGGTFEFGFTHVSGDWRTLEALVTDLRNEPAVGGFVMNARDVTERKNFDRRLHHQATHDTLTGMPNRLLAVQELERMLKHNAGRSTVAAISIDIDDFRDVNDSLGQTVGDDVLRAVSERIKSTLSFGDQAARIGADEFAVILERAHGEEAVLEMTETILDEIAKPLNFNGRELSLSASAGMAVDHDRTDDPESLLHNSITALHEAKRDSVRRIVRFEHSMRIASSDRLELRGDLARAIGTDQLVVNYQPIVRLGNGEIIGAEALVRWDHPERGRLSPAMFIPLAEDSGLIERLDAQVRGQALEDLARWRSEIPGLMEFTVSVNLSVGELHDPELVESVLRDLRLNGLPSSALILEVTESHLLDDTDLVCSQMSSLRTHGIRLAIDDFGTGYSSLAYMDRFEFDVLKIDRSFVAGLSSVTNQRIVTTVLDLASNLDARVIAEGIETESQEDQLMDLGCSIGQGYLYSRPVAASRFRRLLTGHSVVNA